MKTKLVLFAFLVLALILLPGCALPGDPFGNYPSPTPTSISGDRPFFTTEDERVRYILADLQLGNIPLANGTENPPSFQTAYSLWNQGVRVVNIEQFILDPSPIIFLLDNSETITIGAVFYRDSNEIINPKDIILTTDAPVVTLIPTPTDIPTPTSPSPIEAATFYCGNNYWPIVEGATWEFRLFDQTVASGEKWIITSVNATDSLHADFIITVYSQVDTWTENYSCDETGIYQLNGDGSKLLKLPRESDLIPGKWWDLIPGTERGLIVHSFGSVDVPAGHFGVVTLEETYGDSSVMTSYARGVGPVQVSWLSENPSSLLLVDYNIPPGSSTESPTPADVNSLAGLSGKIIYLTEANNVSEVFIMNADGSNLTNITPAGVGQNIYDPALSPDHSKVAFIGGEMDEIYIMDADGTYPIQLTHHASYAGCWALAWSPDGDRIAFDCVSDENGYHQIYSMRPDGSGITNLTNTSGSNSFKPSWSPDGRKIVFQSDRSGNSFDCGGICQAVDDIFVMSSDGSNTVRLTTSRFFHSDPAWSPDGSKIVYHSEDMQGDWFTIMNADGSNAIDLKCDDGFICGYPAWSPDSQKIIFNRYEFVNESGAWVSKNYKIFIMNIDGSNRTFITDGIHPLWVP